MTATTINHASLLVVAVDGAELPNQLPPQVLLLPHPPATSHTKQGNYDGYEELLMTLFISLIGVHSQQANTTKL